MSPSASAPPPYFSDFIGNCALRATLHEAMVTGKPGLVCADTSGAHADMDITTLVRSAVSLAPYFTEATTMGQELAHATAVELFGSLRPLGQQAEITMLSATQGINTHKGLIFSLGLCCAAAGMSHGRDLPLEARLLCRQAGELVQGITERDFAHVRQGGTAQTAGERFFLSTGSTGIRGEAEAGFPHVLEALAALHKAEAEKNFNTACLTALLHLMASVPDSNVWNRGGLEALTMVQGIATQVLTLGISSPKGQKKLAQLRTRCLEQNLSPGGCADLLAVAIFLWMLEKEFSV